LDCSLVSNKKFSEILSSNSLSPEPGKVGQSVLKVLHLWRHTKNPHPSTKKCLSEFRLGDLPDFWAFEQLSTTFGTRVARVQSHVRSGCSGAKLSKSGWTWKC